MVLEAVFVNASILEHQLRRWRFYMTVAQPFTIKSRMLEVQGLKCILITSCRSHKLLLQVFTSNIVDALEAFIILKAVPSVDG